VFDEIIKECLLVVDATQCRDEIQYVMTNRRVTVSCNAWPGMDVPRSVQAYYGLMKNYVGIILQKEYEEISEDSDNLFERGLYRSTYEYFLAHHKK